MPGGLPFTLAPIKSGADAPIWDGEKFCIGSKSVQVLEYDWDSSGWNDELTSFHEDTAGDNHFIDIASREYAMRQILKYANSNSVILEIGCSSGFMLSLMRKQLPNTLIMGADIVFEPLQKIAVNQPHTPLFRFNLLKCPLPDNSIDVIVMLNVLEHIDDDAGALYQVNRILKPGGVVIIEVPAGPELYDVYDKLLMHYRRYSLKHICRIVQEQKFNILKKSHLGFFMYPGFWWVKKRNKRILSEADALHKQRVEININKTKNNKLLDVIMRIELWLGKWFSYPIGIRCLLSIRKPMTNQ
jgi:SAM-dependent methyltransferase